MNCISFFKHSIDTKDDIPLGLIRGIRDLVEYKRRKAAANKVQKATTSRKASENAKRELTTMLLNESETLDDSDADPDFVPAKRGKSRTVGDVEDDDIYIFPGLAWMIFLKNKKTRMFKQM